MAMSSPCSQSLVPVGPVPSVPGSSSSSIPPPSMMSFLDKFKITERNNKAKMEEINGIKAKIQEVKEMREKV